MDCIVHGVAKSRTGLRDFKFTGDSILVFLDVIELCYLFNMYHFMLIFLETKLIDQIFLRKFDFEVCCQTFKFPITRFILCSSYNLKSCLW